MIETLAEVKWLVEAEVKRMSNVHFNCYEKHNVFIKLRTAPEPSIIIL